LNSEDLHFNYLNHIQAQIARMSQFANSCKNWYLLAITFSFAINLNVEDSQNLRKFLFILILIFPLLDIYYLALEKSYIEIWDKAIENLESSRPTWNLKPKIKPKFVFKAVFSISVLPLYLLTEAFLYWYLFSNQ